MGFVIHSAFREFEYVPILDVRFISYVTFRFVTFTLCLLTTMIAGVLESVKANLPGFILVFVIVAMTVAVLLILGYKRCCSSKDDGDDVSLEYLS